MPTYRTTVGPERNITLPAELCRRLNVEEGTPVEFFLTLDGQVHFHAIARATSTFRRGLAERRVPPISIREMDDAIAEHVVEKDERIKRQWRKADKKRQSKQSAAE